MFGCITKDNTAVYLGTKHRNLTQVFSLSGDPQYLDDDDVQITLIYLFLAF